MNSRNLKTLVVDPQIQIDLLTSLPANVLRIAESGVRTPEDVVRLLDAGYDGFLVGEALDAADRSVGRSGAADGPGLPV